MSRKWCCREGGISGRRWSQRPPLLKLQVVAGLPAVLPFTGMVKTSVEENGAVSFAKSVKVLQCLCLQAEFLADYGLDEASPQSSLTHRLSSAVDRASTPFRTTSNPTIKQWPESMCYGSQRLPSTEDFTVNSSTRPLRRNLNESEAVVEDLRDRLAETEARLERARAREAELSRQLEEMKRFVSVMEIIETYLRRRYREQQDQLVRLYSSVSTK